MIFGNYMAPLDQVDQHRAAQLEFIGGLVAAGQIVASGRRASGDGSVIVLSAADGADALALFEADPYVLAAVVDYQLAAEFTVGAKASGLDDYH